MAQQGSRGLRMAQEGSTSAKHITIRNKHLLMKQQDITCWMKVFWFSAGTAEEKH